MFLSGAKHSFGRTCKLVAVLLTCRSPLEEQAFCFPAGAELEETRTCP